jgi:AcrR family transcriptional regulator
LPKNLSPDDILQFRDRLCDAAEHLFVAHGLEAVTIRQLASAIGVSPMTPYRYFKDKDAILAAVRARAFDRHAAALEQAYRLPAKDPVARAASVSDAYVRFALDHPEAYKLMFDITQPGAESYPDLVRAGERSRATMTRHVRDLTEAGLIGGDPEIIGHMYWAALHGPIMLQLSGMLGRFTAERLIAGLTDAITRSIISGPVEGKGQ